MGLTSLHLVAVLVAAPVYPVPLRLYKMVVVVEVVVCQEGLLAEVGVVARKLVAGVVPQPARQPAAHRPNLSRGPHQLG